MAKGICRGGRVTIGRPVRARLSVIEVRMPENDYNVKTA